LMQAAEKPEGATVFCYSVDQPERYGVIEIDDNGMPVGIEEKPSQPKSNLAVTGLYFYDNSVIGIAKTIKPSPRNELEITDVNQAYLDSGKLSIETLGRGHAWLDTGTERSLIEASQFIEAIENRQSTKIACIEEIAYEKGFITPNALKALANKAPFNDYGKYLKKLAAF
jgi:glucose-1-phosphate thymidylyltransferase